MYLQKLCNFPYRLQALLVIMVNTLQKHRNIFILALVAKLYWHEIGTDGPSRIPNQDKAMHKSLLLFPTVLYKIKYCEFRRYFISTTPTCTFTKGIKYTAGSKITFVLCHKNLMFWKEIGKVSICEV